MSRINNNLFQISYKIWWHKLPFKDSSIKELLDTKFLNMFPKVSKSVDGNIIHGDKGVKPSRCIEIIEDGVIFNLEIKDNIKDETSYFQETGNSIIKKIFEHIEAEEIKYNHLHLDLYLFSKLQSVNELKILQNELGIFEKVFFQSEFDTGIKKLRKGNKMIVETDDTDEGLVVQTIYPSKNLYKKGEILSHLDHLIENLS